MSNTTLALCAIIGDVTLDKFQEDAMESIAIRKRSVNAMAHRTLGLSGEAGEAANMIKKIIRDKKGKPTAEDVAMIKEKLGDTLYYVAVLAEYFDLSLSDVGEANLTKSKAFKESRKLY
jgi:NTP pyrophosphatase (non-canonical NTP hydrolase)